MKIDVVVVVVVVVLFNWVFGFFAAAAPPAEGGRAPDPRARADRRWRGGRTERFRGSLLKVAKCHCWLSYTYTCVCLCVCQCVYVSVCRRLLLAGPEIPIGGEMPRLAQ